MQIILIGTDHRIQYSVPVRRYGTWVPRTSPWFSRLVKHCVLQLGAKIILEEAHLIQEKVPPTICSQIANELGIPWEPISFGGLSLSDILFEKNPRECFQKNEKPIPLAGRYNISMHAMREATMIERIGEASQRVGCVLGVVGDVHLGVVAHGLVGKGFDVEALIFTQPLVVEENQA